MKIKIILFSLFFITTSFLVFTYLNSTSSPLLSPLFTQNKPPDLTDKLSSKIYLLPELDYSSSSTLSTISSQINYLVYNPKTLKVYASKNQDQKISPASFTKLMTASVTLDVTQDDPLISTTKTSIDKEPTILGLKIDEQLLLSDLIRASIATSANDAAATIAEGISTIYDQPLSFFINLMNQKAQLLNMKNTRFTNPEGYDDHNQYSNLEDIAKLIANVQKNYPEIISAGQSDMKDIQKSLTHGHYYLPNWNGLLGVYSGVNGLKIAYTEEAGYSTIVTATKNNIPVVVILTGADSIRERDLAAAALLDHAYLEEKIAPENITRADVDAHYQIWNDLATQIKAELKALESADEP